MKNRPRFTVAPVLTHLQVGKLLKHTLTGNDVKPVQALLNFLIVRFLYEICLRAGELCLLRIRDIDIEGKTVTVQARRTFPTIPLPNDLVDTLQTWMFMREDMPGVGCGPDDPLFPSGRGAMSARRLNATIACLCRECRIGTERVGCMTLRHTGVAHKLGARWDVYTLSRFIGQKIQTTESCIDFPRS